MNAVLIALIIVLIIILGWFAYANFVYRKSPERVANICATKYTIVDSVSGDMLASTPGSFFFVDEKSIKWSKNSSGTDVVNCVIEQRNEETQKILKEIPQTFNVVYGKNAQIEKITLRDILI